MSSNKGKFSIVVTLNGVIRFQRADVTFAELGAVVRELTRDFRGAVITVQQNLK